MPDRFEIRSEEVQEVLETMPRGITRWGTSLMAGILALLLLIAGLVKYPDVGRFNVVIKIANDSSGVPPGYHQQAYAQLNLPQTDFSKVAGGKKVQLKFPAYPVHEFGVVNGTIPPFKATANEEDFTVPVRVELPQDGQTTRHRKIEYFNGLQAEVEIVYGQASVLERMIGRHW
ncbi:hypothetical protein HGH92_30440 [Chitinophaga varians]|uniref:HlyD family secretion protein n=1 Tax=Chitinophaga varians TaxID=2202339 RepID=A0A847SAC6_9BACT|nr:hypothetical protein [Chitinophaga varians]NLR68661.1 hypothetical protein [Chitinophaga varians]